jgi:WD repeat-containing protein 24
MSTLNINTTPSESSKAANLKHVGEGALDDSDSSGDEDGDGKSSDGEERGVGPLTSPHLAKSAMGLVHPSPLSRVAGWSEGVDTSREIEDGEDVDKDEDEDEDEDESGPSPLSTDSDSSGSSSPGKRRSRSRRQSLRAAKSRSRSSTVASLAAPPLFRQESVASVMTVTAGPPSIQETDGDSVRSLMRENGSLRAVSANQSRRGSIDHLRELGKGSVERMFPSHKRNRSHAMSLDFGNNVIREGATTEKEVLMENPTPNRMRNENVFSEKRKAVIRAEEEKFCGIGWDALKDALERFADDVGQVFFFEGAHT